MKLAMRIRLARRYAKLSQAALAEKLTVSRGAVANWECAGGVHPVSARMAQIALITHVSYEWLATGRGRMTHQADHEDTPAVDADMVYDGPERRLLQGFREAPAAIKLLLLQVLDSHSPKARKPYLKASVVGADPTAESEWPATNRSAR